MKFLTLIAINLFVLGVFWFRSESPKDKQEHLLEIIDEKTEDTPKLKVSSTITELGNETIPTVAAEDMSFEARKELLEEYWNLLIGDQRRSWCPSKRVDLFREYEKILAYDFAEAKENLEVIIGLDNVSYDFRTDLVDGLLQRMATLDARSAIDFLMEADYDFEDETCENVARIWMDNEGRAIMDWFESSGVQESESQLIPAFLAVYAEEDPYDYLLRYGTHSQGYHNARATLLLYDEYGTSIYDDLKNSGLSSEVLTDSFNSISRQLYIKDAPKAREWIQNNRFSISAEHAKEIAYDLINTSYYRDRQKAIDTIEWSLKQKLLLPTDRETYHIVRRMAAYEPAQMRTVLQNLKTQMGIETEHLSHLLPKPIKDESG